MTKRICQKKGCNEELSQSELEISWGRHSYEICEEHEKELLKVQTDYINKK